MDLSKKLRKMMPQQVCADDLDEVANEIDLLKKEAELLRADPAMHYCLVTLETFMKTGFDRTMCAEVLEMYGRKK